MRPPGPLTSLPILGDLPLIGLGKAVGLGPPPHVRMTELANTYGDVMSLGLGDERWVVLSSPEAVHEAFVTRGMDFSGRPMVPSMKVSSGGGKGFAKPTLTPELKVLRQTARSKLFGAAQVARSQASLEHEAVLLAEDLISASSRDGSVELRPALRSAVTNMVLRTFGMSAAGGSAACRDGLRVHCRLRNVHVLALLCDHDDHERRLRRHLGVGLQHGRADAVLDHHAWFWNALVRSYVCQLYPWTKKV